MNKDSALLVNGILSFIENLDIRLENIERGLQANLKGLSDYAEIAPKPDSQWIEMRLRALESQIKDFKAVHLNHLQQVEDLYKSGLLKTHLDDYIPLSEILKEQGEIHGQGTEADTEMDDR